MLPVAEMAVEDELTVTAERHLRREHCYDDGGGQKSTIVAGKQDVKQGTDFKMLDADLLTFSFDGFCCRCCR